VPFEDLSPISILVKIEPSTYPYKYTHTHTHTHTQIRTYTQNTPFRGFQHHPISFSHVLTSPFCFPRKGLEELETSKKSIEFENDKAKLQKQVREYESKLAEALPLLESLDQTRSEVKDLRWKLENGLGNEDELKKENLRLKEELVQCEVAINL